MGWRRWGDGGVKLMTHLKFSTIFNYDIVWGGGGCIFGLFVCLFVYWYVLMCSFWIHSKSFIWTDQFKEVVNFVQNFFGGLELFMRNTQVTSSRCTAHIVSFFYFIKFKLL